jgi:hypothetical protein
MTKSTLPRWGAAALFVCAFLQAPAGAAAVAEKAFDERDRTHWAFQKVVRPEIPRVTNSKQVRNPIDAFIIAELRARKVLPSPSADKTTLIRRAGLDLIGMPPTPQEIDDFLADKSPEAFARVVDRLLASPHYGERWARHWLDLARYAESEGFKADETRPNAWRYRDYVIQSLNGDKPYDRFVREQIAGDELWPDDPDAQIATAFNRHYPDESNARNLMQRRQEILNDITDTVGAVFTGMTYACARCHDHKFDPILQTDYYRLQAFFANTAARDDVPLIAPDNLKHYREKLAAWEEKTRAIREEMEAIEAPHRRAIVKDYFEKYPAEIQAILNKPEGERNPFERQMAWKAKQYLDPKSHEYIADTAAVAGKLKSDSKKRWQELKQQLDEFAGLHPGELPVGSAMTDIGAEAPATYLLSRGLFDKPKDEVLPGLMQILYSEKARIPETKSDGTTGRRTALANLLADPQNPLTARVMVNRVWHYHFGRGIVGTPSDFGLKGDRPTHPQLLDWLASEFIRTGWSLKALHRLIMTSSTYQQSSAYSGAAAKLDPENKLLWRYPRQRLEGEAIRDSALAVAGMLSPKMGGPSIFPELPTGMPTPRGGWKVNDDASERNRRSVYVFVRRNTRYPMFDSFDMPDPHESCSRRNITTSPIQALALLNSKQTLEWAQGFAGRVLDNAGTDAQKQIAIAFRLAYGRLPDESERRMAQEFFRSHRVLFAERATKGGKLAMPTGVSESIEPVHAAVLVDFCHALINANEFVYRN